MVWDIDNTDWSIKKTTFSADKNDWANFTKSNANNQYNEGKVISDSNNPVWIMPSNEGVRTDPITERHTPCGYWLSEPKEIEYTPPAPYVPSWTLWGAGQNGSMCLGILISTPQPILKEIDFGTVISFGCQNNNGLFVAESNKAIYGIGTQTNGTMPNSSAEGTIHSFIDFMNSGRCKLMSISHSHSLFIAEDGTLWSCGSNSHGQLGRNVSTGINGLGQIGIEDNWSFVHAGIYTTYVINEDNDLWVCGHGGYGNLGLGDYLRKPRLFKALDSCSFVTTPPNWYGQASAITTDGVLYGCGDNNYGGLGLGFTSSRPNAWTRANTDLRFSKSQLTNTSSQECGHFLTTDGDLYVAGYNYIGQGLLGINDGINKTDLTLIPGGLKFVDIESHGYGGFALTDSGDIYITGGNYWGTKKTVWTYYDTGFDKIYASCNNMWAMKNKV